MWSEAFRVRFFDAEPGGGASIPALCRFMEEAAFSHTDSLGISIIQVRETQRMWVLNRFALRVSTLPRIGEEVTVQTWASDRTGGIRAYRDFRVLDGAGKTIAEAASLWLLLDLKSRRPVRLPDSVLSIREPERVHAEPVDATPLPVPASVVHEDHFKVRWSDLDENGHANNIRYIEWILASKREGRLTGFDIQFLNEALLGDPVVALCEQLSDTQFRHSLTGPDGRTLAVAESTHSSSASSLKASSSNPAASA
jgi:medium-chain acyl-[acyl-carrier-protein] hydrolase